MLIVGNYPFDEKEKLFHTQQNVWIKEIESPSISKANNSQSRLMPNKANPWIGTHNSINIFASKEIAL